MSQGNQTTKPFGRDKRGNVSIIFALTAIPVIGIIGMAVDLGRAMDARARLQNSLDAAILAAVDIPLEEQTAMANKFFQANMLEGSGRTTGTVTVSFAHDTKGNFAGEARLDLPTSFMQILGFDRLQMLTVASARPKETFTTTHTEEVTTTTTVPGAIPCIHVLDQNARRSLRLISNSGFDSRKCEIHVRSNDADAILTDSESQVRWKKIRVKGAGGTMISTRDIIMDAPNTIQFNEQIVGDPYTRAVDDVASMITVGDCNTANTDKTFNGGTVNPGTYCGAVTFNGVTFNPGLYIIATGKGNKVGALTLKGKLNGAAGVSFYLADNKTSIVSYAASEGSILKAPTTGVSQGLLFFEGSNRGQNWSLNIASMSKNVWNGVIYLPSANLTLRSWSADSGQTMAFGMVVNQLEMNSFSGITNTYAWTPYMKSEPITLPSTTTTTTTTVTRTIEDERKGWLNN